jgi:hypothetical protein
VVKVVEIEVEEITILINVKVTMEEQKVEVKEIQISTTSLKFNAISTRNMITIGKIVNLIFNVITTKGLIIISMSASLKTQIIKICASKTLFLASCNIEKEEEVSLMMHCHMNKKNEKGEFETKWELINKVKEKLKRKSKV